MNYFPILLTGKEEGIVDSGYIYLAPQLQLRTKFGENGFPTGRGILITSALTLNLTGFDRIRPSSRFLTPILCALSHSEIGSDNPCGC